MSDTLIDPKYTHDSVLPYTPIVCLKIITRKMSKLKKYIVFTTQTWGHTHAHNRVKKNNASVV